MRHLVVTIVIIALCYGSVVPPVPGDNSHYVEGESRYVWMPDGKGEPVLVDLHEPVDEEILKTRNGANNQYWLFTRSNPTNPQVIVHGNANTIWSSNYNGALPLNVIVHGWDNNGWSEMNPSITASFLAVTNCNVIVVDWSALANDNYSPAVAGVPSVGQHLGNFLVWLRNTGGGAWNNVHLVGFSLGAHVVGVAGRQAGGRPARVTGLDPAGYQWHNNPNRLSSNAGVYVEAIHTDGGRLGIWDPIGDANFYPNGGMQQPGCWIGAAGSPCSHGRATEFFSASVRFNHLVGRRCNNIWEAQLATCNGATLNMGNGDWNKRGVVPPVPGDNSHYVEGESRYVWMPDGKGEPVLVDLHEPVDEEILKTRNGANNQYWLFTRSNPTNPQVIVHGNANTIWSSNYNGALPLNVIVHGWDNNGWSEMNPSITASFLAVTNCNVIVVDWSALANDNYSPAVAGVPSVGQHLGNFLVWLRNTGGGAWNNVHLVGFSLGAHVVGVAGRQAGGRPARVTGLDPAGYQWHNNPNRLSSNAGVYVEAIHTDGGRLGIWDPIGDANFYPNGGMQQPGCWIGAAGSPCSHGRATEFFSASVRFNHLVGRRCNNIWEAQLATCNGATLNMGNGDWNKRGNGIYALNTGSSWPF